MHMYTLRDDYLPISGLYACTCTCTCRWSRFHCTCTMYVHDNNLIMLFFSVLY